MAFFANYKPILIGSYDDELLVSHFPSLNNGKFMGRDSLENVHHAGGSPQLHPSIPNVMRNYLGHVHIKGTFQYVCEWPDGGITEDDIDQYIALIGSYNLPAGQWDVIKTGDVNKFIINFSAPIEPITEWSLNVAGGVEWFPAAPKMTQYHTSDESEILCVTRLGDMFSRYAYDRRTIEPSEQYTIDRPTCEKCFVIFTEDVSSGTKQLTSKKAYKLTSDSLTITNTSDKRVMIMRYYRM